MENNIINNELDQTTVGKILRIIADGECYSGQSLGEMLGMSRTAIWKAIKKITESGTDIEAIACKGYRLKLPIELLNKTQIESQCSASTLKSLNSLALLKEVDSTNDYLLSLASNNNADAPIAVFAEKQLSGRGRRGRTWTSPFGNNIYFSLLWQFHKDPAECFGLSLAVGVAIIRSLKRYGMKNEIAIKWPNDIVYNTKKLAGVLIEMTASTHETTNMVVGIGLNTILSEKDSQTISQPCTSIANITESLAERNKLAGILLDETIKAMQTFDEAGLAPFLNEYHEHDALYGNPIQLQTPKAVIEGIMDGVTEQGALRVKREDGTVKTYLSGEANKIRGV